MMSRNFREPWFVGFQESPLSVKSCDLIIAFAIARNWHKVTIQLLAQKSQQIVPSPTKHTNPIPARSFCLHHRHVGLM